MAIDHPTAVSLSVMERERYLLRRAGYGFEEPCSVMLCRMDANGLARCASYDPYSWGQCGTMPTAHKYIVDYWGELRSGAVIDVEFIAGETKSPKVSEQFEE